MSLKAWEDFAVEPLSFPIAGKTYTPPPLGYKAGLLLQRTLSGEDKTLFGKPASELWRVVLGPAFDEMVKDNVPIEALGRAGMTALTDFQFGRQTAERVWETGIDPEVLAAAATAANPKVSRRSTSTGAARRTPPRASTSGTRVSRKK